MSPAAYACHLIRRTAGVMLVCIVSYGICSAAAKRATDADIDDPLARARRNIVAVVDWDRTDGKALLGSGVLLQRDKALIPCRIAASARNLGVSQEQRRSEARLTGERAGRGLCELKIIHPVHFDPLPLEIRPIDEVAVGDSVYAISTGAGRDLSMVRARVSGIAGAGENKVIRISRRINASAGSALFDRSGALLGINALHSGRGEETA